MTAVHRILVDAGVLRAGAECVSATGENLTSGRRRNSAPPRDLLIILIFIEGQGERVIGVEDWAEIRRLHRAEQMPIRAIARHLGISKNTVKHALASDWPPVYQRPLKGSAVEAFEPVIRELLKLFEAGG
jgi:transposase